MAQDLNLEIRFEEEIKKMDKMSQANNCNNTDLHFGIVMG